ncbi:MAG: MipA/OmpV family protein [Pseudomonadota bacterium]
MLPVKCVSLGLVAALAAAVPAFADDDPTHNLTVGLGIGFTADYEGSDDLQVIPIAPITYENRFVTIRSIGLGLEADLVPSKAIDIGPMFRYRFSRDDVDDVRIDALPDVDASLELGGFVRTGVPLELLGIDDPTIIFAQLSAMHDVIDGHGGALVEGRTGVIRPLTESLTGIVSVSTTYASEDFMNSFFDVTAAGSAASGLRAFDADAGLKDVGVAAILNYKINDKWSTTLLGGYSRLIGDAADSPVVTDAGSENQFMAGFSVNYKLF